MTAHFQPADGPTDIVLFSVLQGLDWLMGMLILKNVLPFNKLSWEKLNWNFSSLIYAPRLQPSTYHNSWHGKVGLEAGRNCFEMVCLKNFYVLQYVWRKGKARGMFMVCTKASLRHAECPAMTPSQPKSWFSAQPSPLTTFPSRGFKNN